jgi:hypothetical protein
MFCLRVLGITPAVAIDMTTPPIDIGNDANGALKLTEGACRVKG